MSNTFMPVNPLWYYTQMAVPTVFTPELTNEEAQGKMLYKLNEVIAQLNNVPGLIDTKISEAFDQSGIEEEIKDILSSMQLSVKNPPEGVPTAKGDGKTNDTAAINGLINYANNLATQTGIPMAVLIPTGNYAVTGLQLKDNVSLIGEDMYNTVIKVMDYTNAPAIIGSLGNSVIGNFTLDGNSANNASNFTGAEITAVGPLNISSVRFIDFKAGDTALSLTPNAVVQISTLRAESAAITIEQGTDIVYMEDALLLNCPTAAIINNNNNTFIRVCGNKNLKELVVNNGDNCYIIAWGGAVTDNSIDSRVVSENMDKLMVGSLSLQVLGNMELSAENVTDTVTGVRTIKSGNVVDTVTGAKTVNAASETVTLTGKQTIKANSREVDLSDADVIQVGSLETTASYQTQTVTNIMDTNYGDLTEGVAGDKHVTVGNNSTETVVKSKTINADNLVLNGTKGIQAQGARLNINTTDPLQYSKPLQLNQHYNYIPMIDEEGNTYQILVFNGTDPTPEVPESHLPTYINVKELGAKGDGTTDDTAAFQSAAGFSGFIFVPAGTYLITSVTMLGGIKGIIGEMSTIKSSITSGNMLTFTAAANLAAIILDAAGAENAVSSPNGININQSILNGNVAGPINMTACSVNNNSQLSCTDNSRILGSRVNGNIALAAGVNAEITGNAISGSFVFVLSAGQKIGSLAVTGNVFNPAVTISDANITTYRASGNVGLADYPPIVPDPFDYNIPNNQPLTLKGTAANKDVTINNTGANLLELRRGGDLIAQVPSDDSLFIIQHNLLLNAGVSLPQNQYITFRTPDLLPTLTWGVNADGVFGLRSNWLDILTLSQEQNSLSSTIPIIAPNLSFAVINNASITNGVRASVPFGVNPISVAGGGNPSTGGLHFGSGFETNVWAATEDVSTGNLIFWERHDNIWEQMFVLNHNSGNLQIKGNFRPANGLNSSNAINYFKTVRFVPSANSFANGYLYDTNPLNHNLYDQINSHHVWIYDGTTYAFQVPISAPNFSGGGSLQQSAHITDFSIGTAETGITLAQCGLTVAQANAGGILVNCVGATTSTGASTNISGVQLVADMETGTPTNVYSFTQTGPIFLDLRWKNWSGTGNNAFGVQGTSGGGAGKKIDLRIYYVPLS